MSDAVLVMLLLTPLVIRFRIPSWTVGWLAILLGYVAVMALLGLAERLTVPNGRPLLADDPES
ncbi:hypothetical protein [Streptomyces europaeiscabiei]|uniref:hypothetical protein n=1 Tax=Streptomyces europaeiscabiei TaxID=146819 RepID=UPI002E2B4ADC|nr:hypothetical protein [Streptomyces europaeiscabiei]